MANYLNGATPVSTLSGAPWQASVREYTLDGSHAEIHVGDLVEMTADGFPDLYTAGIGNVLGVCVGILPSRADKSSGITGHQLSTATLDLNLPAANRSLANATDTILVATDASIILEMTEDGGAGFMAYTAIGANVTIIAGTASTTTGLSGQQVDSSSVAATSTLPLKVIGVVDRPDNAIGAAGARWLVTINNHHFMGAGTAI